MSNYSGNVILNDVLCTIRSNIDYLLVGYFWGVEILGIYFFAFNAGLGISLSLQNAISTALLPYLCQQSREQGNSSQAFYQSLRITIALVTALVLAQTTLASTYVPIVFGERWVEAGAVPVMIILCWSALPRAVAEAIFAWLRAAGHPDMVSRLNTAMTLAFCICVSVAVPFGIVAVAWAVLGVQMLLTPIFLLMAHYRITRNQKTDFVPNPKLSLAGE